MRKHQQIITTIVMGSAVAALSVNVANATPAANTVTKAPSGDLLAQIPPAPSPNQQPLVARSEERRVGKEC